MHKLLVNADDFGLHTSVNEAINNCVQASVVNSTSAMANGKALDIDLLKKFADKGIYIGVHITWVNEPWLTENIFIESWRQLVVQLITGGKKFKQKLIVEAEAQINTLAKHNIPLHHIDSHQHVHHFPGLYEILNALQAKYNIERLRVAKVKSGKLMRGNLSGMVLNLLASNINTNNSYYCAGIKHAGNYNTNLLKEEIYLASGCDTELIVHPGNNNNLLNERYANWHFNWEQEYQSLLNPNFKQAIANNGFVIPYAK